MRAIRDLHVAPRHHLVRVVDRVRDLDPEAHLEAVYLDALHFFEVRSDLLRPLGHFSLVEADASEEPFHLLAHFVLLPLVNLLNLVLPQRLEPINSALVSQQVAAAGVALDFGDFLEEVRTILLDDEDVDAGHLLTILIKTAQAFAEVGHLLLADPC